jgi:hypothetical protein
LRARRLRALLAAGILLAVVVGAPVALLAVVGNPLPAALPSPEAIRLALDSGNLSPHSLAKGLALVLWACWAYFTLTGVASAFDAIRHRSRPSLRLPSPSTRLVAVVAGALWFSTAPLKLASAAALPTSVPVHLLATTATASTPPPSPTPSPARSSPDRVSGTATQAAGPHTYVVQPRDTLWGIATRTLGAGERWREIYQLNRDRVMDNGVRFDDPSLIEPGWVLELPPATAPTAQPSPRRAPEPRKAPLATPLHRGVEKAPTPAVPPSIASPDAIAAHASAPTPAPAPTATPVGAEPAPSPARQSSGSEERRIALGAGALLGGAILADLARRRRLQARTRPRHHRIATPAPRLSAALRPLADAADLDATTALDVAMRLLGQELLAADATDELLEVVSVRIGADAIEIDRGAPGSATTTFAPTETGWRVARSALDTHRTIDACTPLPCLATLAEADTATLVNLERYGALALDGEPDVVADALRAIATEFVTAPWTERAWLVLFGVATELGALEHVTVVSDVDAELRRLERHRSEAIEIALRQANPYANRIAGDGGAVPARLVVVGPDVDRATCTRLVELAGVGAVVVGGANLPARTRRPVGALPDAAAGVEAPPRLDEETLRAYRDVVTVANDPVATPAPPVRFAPRPDLEGAEVAIALLGPPTLRASTRVRPAVVELVAYLALHRDRAPFSRDELSRRLWSGSGQSPKTVQNRLSEALALQIGDRPAIERGLDDRLALRADVVSDWERFQALAGSGDLDAAAEALRLLRGVPLSGWEDHGWVAEELLVYEIDRLVVDFVLDAGDAFLRADRPRDAELAARQGLVLSPAHEECCQLLLRAASALEGGERLQATMRWLVGHVREATDGDDELSGDCWTLYRKLGGDPATQLAE